MEFLVTSFLSIASPPFTIRSRKFNIQYIKFICKLYFKQWWVKCWLWCSICKLTQTGYEDIQIIIPWSSSQGLYCYISLNVIYFGLSQNFCQYRFYNVLNWTFLRRWKYRNIVKNDLIYSKNIWILCEKSFFQLHQICLT